MSESIKEMPTENISGMCRISLDRLRPGVNYRKHSDHQKELEDSIKQRGILVPLLVRPIELGVYEIVGGHRRYKAAKALGLKDVPADVKVLTDQEVKEISLIDNIQRENVHPLEEAEAIRQLLMEPSVHGVPDIAARIGKPVRTVYQRLQLCHLIDNAQEQFLEGTLNGSHALLIARLTPEQQRATLKWCLEKAKYRSIATPGELSTWIQTTYHLDLSKAPFAMEDKTFPGNVGSCVECPKRTGFNTDLFPEVKQKDICTDPACYNGKIEVTIARHKNALGLLGVPYKFITEAYWIEKGAPKGTLMNGQWREAKGEGTVEAVIVDSERRGHRIRVKVLEGPDQTKEELKRKLQTSKERRASNLKAMIQVALFQEIRKHLRNKLDTADLFAIHHALVDRLHFDTARSMCKQLGIQVDKAKGGYADFTKALEKDVRVSLSDASIIKRIMELAIGSYIKTDQYTTNKVLAGYAKNVGIKVKALEDKITKQEGEKWAKREKRSTEKSNKNSKP